MANLATYVGATFASQNADDAARELPKVARAIDLAVLLGARSIRGFRGPQYDNAPDIPRLVPWIQRCCEYAAQKGIYMGLENHRGTLSGNPEACRDLAARVGSRYFGILYDCNLSRAAWTTGPRST